MRGRGDEIAGALYVGTVGVVTLRFPQVSIGGLGDASCFQKNREVEAASEKSKGSSRGSSRVSSRETSQKYSRVWMNKSGFGE
jgi:hypothetical protein